MKLSGVYAIISPSGRRYVGSAVDVKQRFREHRSMLNRGTHHCKALQRAAAKYGVKSFIFIMTDAVARTQLLEVEQARIDALQPRTRYNSAPVAGSLIGFKHSDEARARMSESRKGVPKTAATRAAMGAWQRGRTLSLAHRANIGARTRERVVTEAARTSMKVAQSGRKHSEASKNKRSIALTGRKTSRNTSGFVGVVQNHGNWQASYTRRGKTTYVGTFATAAEANAARLVAIAALPVV